MFRFANPEYLYLLFIVPILWGIYLYGRYRSKKNIHKFGRADVLAPLMPDVSPYKPAIKFFWQQLAVIVLIFMIARPQFGTKTETVKRQGVEIMIALDVSNSMMAQDITPNRLEKAKMMLSKLVDELDNDKVGLIVFAGDAYTQLPITSDFVSAKMFLNSINPKMIPTQGTAIGQAIALATKSFTSDTSSDKGIIVITDGENHEGDAVKMAKAAAEKGIKVNVIGIGSTQGVPIPTEGGRSRFIKDKKGDVVISKLNETMAKEIAQAGDGIYVRADNTNSALRTLLEEIGGMKKSELESKVYTAYDEQYQGLAWIVLVLLIADVFVLNRKNSWLKKVEFFSDDKK